ncbi:MAG TPA: hypothetical protein ENI31_01580 [Candidatus Omnitrophica bacterium]|nr:hypothetical protein [Candidatus Omnitrophota bacterium]
MELGLFKKLEFIGRPLVRLANLPKESAITFVTSMGSVLAGNALLTQFHREERIDAKQTFLSALLNGIPVYIKETFTYQIPIMIPILGIKIGGIYFLSFILSGFAKLFFVISFGKVMLKKNNPDEPPGPVNLSFVQPIKRKFTHILFLNLRKQAKIFFKIALSFVLMTFIVFLLINIGVLNKAKNTVEPLTGFFKLPPESILPVTTYMFSPLIGATSVSTLVKEGKLTDFQAIITCMLGGFLMLPVFSLRYSLAKYTAIFGFGLGINIILVSALLGMLIRGIFLLVFLFMI